MQGLTVIRQRSWLAMALMAGIATSAHAVTVQQAHELPEPELAKLVLGEAGKLFVEVRRSDEIATPHSNDQAAPLRSLEFYARPTVLYASQGVEDLCKAQSIKVSFSREGAVDGMYASEVFGLSQGFADDLHMPKPDHDQARQQQCKSTSAQSFIRLQPNLPDVGALMRALVQVHEAMAHGGAPWLKVSCFMSDRCDSAEEAWRVGFANVWDVSLCSPAWSKSLPSGRQATKALCWSVNLRGGVACMSSRGLQITATDDDDRVTILSASYAEGRVMC